MAFTSVFLGSFVGFVAFLGAHLLLDHSLLFSLALYSALGIATTLGTLLCLLANDKARPSTPSAI